MDFARERGGSALRVMSFAERGALLKAVADVLTENRAKYEEIARINSGNTKVDASIDIDGGIGTLKYYSRIGKSLAMRQWSSRPVRISWPRTLCFSPGICGPRGRVSRCRSTRSTSPPGHVGKDCGCDDCRRAEHGQAGNGDSLAVHEMMRDVDAANVVPEGVFSLVCGNGEGLLDAWGRWIPSPLPGSADTGSTIRSHPVVLKSGARVTIEADSVNATILGPDVAPGDPLFDLAVREVARRCR
ncbi:aldehyde dehydrogenase family protein [uncultured Roseibium sp.]|uniref:aldehyde dehydrogenase family protein n=1 Tax=uncultured Roseibium sp. TaxID=1936171 RepID=UPI0032169CF5